MHRLTNLGLGLTIALLSASSFGCGGPKKKVVAPADMGLAGASEEAPSGSAGGAAGGATKAKSESCTGSDIQNLEDMLARSECEVPNLKPEAVRGGELNGKLDVTLSSASPSLPAGGKVELIVTFANKSRSPLPLDFRIDPLARFETETFDAKAKRADMPTAKQPAPPKGHTPPPPAEAKVAKITIAPNGSARVRIPWEAVKMKWAPEKVRGTPVERGFPRAPAGPLAKGKYTVKVVTPLLGVAEELAAPKLDLEVTK